jgi:hypothetical protein
MGKNSPAWITARSPCRPPITTGSAQPFRPSAARWSASKLNVRPELRIAKAYSVLEYGKALVPEVVIRQSQDGFAMGVGYALLETLPPFGHGLGNGNGTLAYISLRAI